MMQEAERERVRGASEEQEEESVKTDQEPVQN